MGAVEEVRWESDDLVVGMLPGLGCRLHRITFRGTDLLRTPPDPAAHAEDPFFWGAYVMAPWTNRATARPMTIAGRRVDLPANFPDGTAIHGHVYGRAWERRGPNSFGVVVPEGSGWPWAYEVTVEIGVDGASLRLACAVTNHADAPMPAGIGLHPWFRRPLAVSAHARAVHPRNDEPDASEVPAAGSFDLGGERALPSGLDATWLDVDPHRMGLRWPAERLRATFGADPDAGPLHLAVATPDEPAASAVEPVTHVPWALDRLAAGAPDAMRILPPGDAVTLVIGFAFAPDR